MNKKWRIIIAVVVVLLIVLVVAKKQGWIGVDKNMLEVEVGAVESKTIVETVTASGKIQPETEVKISSEVSGEIIELPIVEGQHVKEGDLLVRINPDLYESAVTRAMAAVNSAKSAYASSKAQFVEAEKSYDRNKKLFEEEVISQAEYDAALRGYKVSELGVESAKYQLRSAEANLDEARKNLKRTTIMAPADGTISMLSVELGERVVGTAQMTGTEMLRVANLQVMEVLVEVNENDIVRVKLGDTALIEVDAYMDEKFKGVVTEIANSANVQGASADQVTNFEVKVRILPQSYAELAVGDKSPFRPGMTATVDIQTKRVSNVLAVPIRAVTVRSDTSTNAKSYRRKKDDEEQTEETDEEFEVVFIANDGKADLKVVKTGVQDDKMIEILSGLTGNEEIVIGPYDVVSKKIKNGSPISLKGGKDNEKDDE